MKGGRLAARVAAKRAAQQEKEESAAPDVAADAEPSAQQVRAFAPEPRSVVATDGRYSR